MNFCIFDLTLSSIIKLQEQEARLPTTTAWPSTLVVKPFTPIVGPTTRLLCIFLDFLAKYKFFSLHIL